MIDVIAQALPLAVVASTPLLLAVEGETVVERSGIINLGIEGMMLTGAMTAVIAAQLTGSTVAGFAGGIAGALFIGALFGLFTIVRRADQIVTGTAINLLALGLTGFAWRELEQRALFTRGVPRITFDVIVPFAWIIVPIALALMLWNTSFGLRLRACGENPEAVTASGASVDAHRWIALIIESVLAGIGGAYLALALSSGFAENMTAGRGFIALSIVIFGRWKLKGALLGTAVFGATAAIQYALQATSRGVPFHLLLAAPYIVTLLILCGIAGRVRAPESLGK
ncbi:MAG: ral nucleoside transport system permease protein [Acidobacteriota bacterium]|jgi:simple sugar transport system permease protein|nr:ral nucleoside transport system permease protein [Acidobacteriota bacterium]